MENRRLVKFLAWPNGETAKRRLSDNKLYGIVYESDIVHDNDMR